MTGLQCKCTNGILLHFEFRGEKRTFTYSHIVHTVTAKLTRAEEFHNGAKNNQLTSRRDTKGCRKYLYVCLLNRICCFFFCTFVDYVYYRCVIFVRIMSCLYHVKFSYFSSANLCICIFSEFKVTVYATEICMQQSTALLYYFFQKIPLVC